MHLYLITVLTKVIAIVFVFENFIAFVVVFKCYAVCHVYTYICMVLQEIFIMMFSCGTCLVYGTVSGHSMRSYSTRGCFMCDYSMHAIICMVH